jgi:hemoglobin-like flavoprotein
MVITTRHRIIIVSSFVKVAAEKRFATMFYERLFELDPTLRTLFKVDIEDQGHKLTQVLTTIIRGLGQVQTLTPVVQELGRRHTSYGVKHQDYQTVGEALIWSLEKALGDEYTPRVKEAWLTLYTYLANIAMEASPTPTGES